MNKKLESGYENWELELNLNICRCILKKESLYKSYQMSYDKFKFIPCNFKNLGGFMTDIQGLKGINSVEIFSLVENRIIKEKKQLNNCRSNQIRGNSKRTS